MVRYVKDQIRNRILAIIHDGPYLLLVDAENPEQPPYSISAACLRKNERFIELTVASTKEDG